jgi:hypothetical protein
MKVLFITHHYINAIGGGSFATKAFINAFAAISDSLLLFYPCQHCGEKVQMASNIMAQGFHYSKPKIFKLTDIYRGRLNRYRKEVFRHFESFNPDLVVFDNSRTSCGIIEKMKQRGLKIITIHHNYEMEYYRGTPPPFYFRLPFMYHLQRAEKKSVHLSDLNLTLTTKDIELLQTNYDPGKNSLFEKIGCFESLPQLTVLPPKIENTTSKTVFAITGSLNSYQTEISLMPFLEMLFPVIMEIVPDCELIIAGRNPSAKIKQAIFKYGKCITLIENPEDMQATISRAHVYICPTNVGGGLKLRVMDGLKTGLPILSHSVSARGYEDFEAAGFLFEYHDLESFRLSLITMLERLRNKSFDNANIQALFIKIFSFESGVNRLKQILKAHEF